SRSTSAIKQTAASQSARLWALTSQLQPARAALKMKSVRSVSSIMARILFGARVHLSPPSGNKNASPVRPQSDFRLRPQRGKVQEMPVFIGAPGGIRTPDPQPSNLEVGVRISRGAPFRDTLSAPNATALALDSSHFRSPAASAAAAHVAMPCAINC